MDKNSRGVYGNTLIYNIDPQSIIKVNYLGNLEKWSYARFF